MESLQTVFSHKKFRGDKLLKKQCITMCHTNLRKIELLAYVSGSCSLCSNEPLSKSFTGSPITPLLYCNVTNENLDYVVLTTHE